MFTKVSTKARRLTITKGFARIRASESAWTRATKRTTGRAARLVGRPKLLMKKKTLASKSRQVHGPSRPVDPAVEQQLKLYEEALQHFQQQKYAKAKPLFEKVIAGPSKEFADRARVHLRIVEQRMQPSEAAHPALAGGALSARRGHDEHGPLGRGPRTFAAGAQAGAQSRLRDLRHGGARLPDGRSRIGDGKSESWPFSCARKIAITRATTRTSLSCRKTRGSPSCCIPTATVPVTSR